MKIIVLLLSVVLLGSSFSMEDSAKAMKFQISPAKSLQLADPVPWPFTICGTGKWTITNLYLSGQPTEYFMFDFYWIGVANAKIDFQRVQIDITYNGSPVGGINDTSFTDSVDAGDQIQYARRLSSSSPWPPGKVGLKFNFYNVAGLNEGCAEFSFQL